MNDRTNKTIGETSKPPPIAALPIIEVDWDYYMELLAEVEGSEADKRELIETLWAISMSFVDFAFGTHPVQLANGNGCAQKSKSGEKSPPSATEMLNYALADIDQTKGGQIE